jgi:hypothetical protein
MCSPSSFSEIGSSFVTSGVASLENSAHFFILELYSGSSASLVSQSPHMAAALLIFCRSWAASVSVFSMRSPPTHIWTCCMQLGVTEKKNVCKSTSPEKPSLGPCSINSLNPFQAWSMLTVQNRAQVHRKPTGDLVPFSARRVLPKFVNPRIGSKPPRFSI